MDHGQSPELRIVIVSYNSHSLLLSAPWRDFMAESRWPVVIVDNHSPDGSGELLAAAYPVARVIALGANLGYGRAANRGFAASPARFGLLLNPDLEVSVPAVEGLLELARSDADGTAIWAPATMGGALAKAEPERVEAVSGAAMLFEQRMFARLGGFDEAIFLYSEETDLCLRARRAGLTIKLCRSIGFPHAGNGSSGAAPELDDLKNYHFAWSRCYFLAKHGLASGKRSPLRLWREYRLRSWFSVGGRKRREYRAKRDGARAFLDGRGAFTDDGRPYRAAGGDEEQNNVTVAGKAFIKNE